MTLQIAAICNTGWVLASDRRELLVHLRSSTSKISTDRQLGITYALVGASLVAEIAVQELVAEMNAQALLKSEMDLKRALEALANRAWQKACDTITSETIDPDLSAQGLTIFFHDSPTVVWALYIGRISVAQSFSDKRIRGDFTNLANFFVERYYSSALSPSDLAFLATHTICVAPRFNSSGIGGLDITVCENGTVRELSAGEVRQLQQRSLELDMKLGDYFKS